MLRPNVEQFHFILKFYSVINNQIDTNCLQDSNIGSKKVWFSNNLLVEKQDATLFKEGDTVTFINWGNMKVANIRKDDAGDIVSIEADLDLDNKA